MSRVCPERPLIVIGVGSVVTSPDTVWSHATRSSTVRPTPGSTSSEHGRSWVIALGCRNTPMFRSRSLSDTGGISAAGTSSNESGPSLEFAQPSGTVYIRPPKSGSQVAPGSSLGTKYWDWYVPVSSSPRQSSLGHPASHQTPGTALNRAAQSSESGVTVSVRPLGDSDQEYVPTSPASHPLPLVVSSSRS